MAERTYYEWLEVSNTASTETIQAAYERLSAKLDPAKNGNASDPAARMQFDAFKQAYLTLMNPELRAAYDRKLELRASVNAAPVAADHGFWTLPKAIALGILVLSAGGYYYKADKKEQARIEAEKAVAVAKAKEAEAKAKADAEAALLARAVNASPTFANCNATNA